MIKFLRYHSQSILATAKSSHYFSTHQLNYGQGGFCHIDLKNTSYNYKIQFETIWEDHCKLEVDGLQDENQLSILQDGNKATIHDFYSKKSESSIVQKVIKIKFKIPQDYTFYGEVNGSINYLKNNISNKLRCNEANIKLLGKQRGFQFGSMESPNLNVAVQNGNIDIKSLTFENGNFICDSFSSSKVLFSGKFNLKSNLSSNIRSVVTYGNAIAKISSKFTEIQSISGSFDIQCEKIKIDRMWASANGIKIKTNRIQKIGIETGTGFIESEQAIDDNSIIKGKLFKGKITKIGNNKLVIQ